MRLAWPLQCKVRQLQDEVVDYLLSILCDDAFGMELDTLPSTRTNTPQFAVRHETQAVES